MIIFEDDVFPESEVTSCFTQIKINRSKPKRDLFGNDIKHIILPLKQVEPAFKKISKLIDNKFINIFLYSHNKLKEAQ